ncbi:MAG: alginate export family protein [Bdellovibrionota bacterium]
MTEYSKIHLWVSFCAVILFLWGSAAGAASIEAIQGLVFRVSLQKSRVKVDPKLVPVELIPGDLVETGSASSARIQLEKDTEVTLGENTEFAIPTNAASNQLKSWYEIFAGRMRVLVNRTKPSAQDSFKIKTRDALMGVRGTEFVIEANRDRSVVCAFDGEVEVSALDNPENSRLVAANQGIVVDRGQQMSEPVAMDRLQMDWWRKQTTLDLTESSSTRLRVLRSSWDWNGPTAVDYLDPALSYSEYQLLSFGGDLWSRVSHMETSTAVSRASKRSGQNLSLKASLNAKAVPTRNYLFFVEGAAALKTGHLNPDAVGGSLQQAFWLVRHHSSHSLALGRQEWHLGDGLMVGRDPWTPFSRRFDGALATYRSAPVRVRALFSILDDRKPTRDFEDFLSGVYANFSGVPLDLYALWVKRSGNSNLLNSKDIDTDHWFLGERLELVFAESFFLNEELSLQTGGLSVEAREKSLLAFLAYADAGSTWSLKPISGNLRAVFLHASGDSDPNDGRASAFLPLLPDSHRFLGIVNAFPQIRNIRRLGGSSSLRFLAFERPVLVDFDYSYFMRASTNDSAYPVVLDPSSSDLGHELDLRITYEARPSLLLQVGGGYLMPGKAYGSNPSNATLAFFMSQFKL